MQKKIMTIFVVAMLAMPATIFATVNNDQVTSIKIKEADGSTGQDPNVGSGIKTAHIQDGAVTDAKIRVFRFLVEAPRIKETAVLMDFQQKVSDIPIPVSHSL